MIVSEITLYNTLKTKLGEQEAQAVVEGIKHTVREEFTNKKDVLATKEDLANAKVDIIKWLVGSAIAIISLVIAGVKLL
jgi:hypothetical protein